MTKRSQRMQPVVGIARREEETRLRACGQARQRLADAEAKLRQLQDYRDEYRQRMASQTPAVVDLTQLQAARYFLERLQDAIRQQQAEVLRLAQAVTASQSAWMSARQHSESLDSLASRYRREELNEMERKAQARADDLSSQRMVWGARESLMTGGAR